MKDYSSEFNQCWERFRLNVKAKLMEHSEDSRLKLSIANLALKDAGTGWLDEFDILGSWLKGLKKAQPAKAEKIERIIRYELSFQEAERDKGLADIASYAVPIGGALAGAGISVLKRANFFVTAASIILPAAVLTPVMKKVKQNQEQEIDKKLIGKYMEQLNPFKEKILELLQE